jgi:hypothetical protein
LRTTTTAQVLTSLLATAKQQGKNPMDLLGFAVFYGEAKTLEHRAATSGADGRLLNCTTVTRLYPDHP